MFFLMVGTWQWWVFESADSLCNTATEAPALYCCFSVSRCFVAFLTFLVHGACLFHLNSTELNSLHTSD